MAAHATIEIFKDGKWQRAAFYTPDPGLEIKGIAASGCFEYDTDYAADHFAEPASQVSVVYPVNFELHRKTGWPAFLLDLLPSGAGRGVWLKRLELPDNEAADWPLLLHGAGFPPGNLRIAEAVAGHQFYPHPGFSQAEVISRHADFIEYAEENGAFGAGASDVQGEAPKCLLTVDHQGRWHAEGSLPDHECASFWLVKFPRGKTQVDFDILFTQSR